MKETEKEDGKVWREGRIKGKEDELNQEEERTKTM